LRVFKAVTKNFVGSFKAENRSHSSKNFAVPKKSNEQRCVIKIYFLDSHLEFFLICVDAVSVEHRERFIKKYLRYQGKWRPIMLLTAATECSRGEIERRSPVAIFYVSSTCSLYVDVFSVSLH
jgi:hypothetical protein